jgi:transcriptional antiterminator
VAEFKTWTIQQLADFLQVSTHTVKRKVAKKTDPRAAINQRHETVGLSRAYALVGRER